MASKLAKIDIPINQNPFELLKEWIDDYKNYARSMPLIFNLATSSCKGDVTNRSVVLRGVDNDGLIFNTNRSGPKARQIEENPKVAACFQFSYLRENSQFISRQVRIEGSISKFADKLSEATFNSFPLHVKIRCLLFAEQSAPADWDDSKRKHDDLLDKVLKNQLELKPSENIIEYKIVPNWFDFYHACESDNEIADRVCFKPTLNGEGWTHHHLTA